MTRMRRVAIAMLACCWLGTPGASAAPLSNARPAALKLADGVNNVKLGSLALRILKGKVGLGTAASYDTYTIYLILDDSEQQWMQVTFSEPRAVGYNFRTIESGDANLRAVAFYVESNHLYVVQATKIGNPVDANGSRRTPFDFEIFRFNESEDVPRFNSERKSRSRAGYVDGSEALEREFFAR